MTQTQKFLKCIENINSMPEPKAQITRRLKNRGSEYRARIDTLSAAHESKRLRLLEARREHERAAESATKAA